jgi:hypothetical protein
MSQCFFGMVPKCRSIRSDHPAESEEVAGPLFETSFIWIQLPALHELLPDLIQREPVALVFSASAHDVAAG